MKELIYAAWMLVGTYTGEGSHGIYVYGFEPQSARTVLVDSVVVENPSYLVADGGLVFAVSENNGPSWVSTCGWFGDGLLIPFFRVPVSGAAPCNVATNGNIVVTANYTGGDVSVIVGDELRQSLKIAEIGSHMHCVKFSPDGKYLFAADLGTDKIARWRVRGQRVDESSLTTFDLPKGSGPRHFIFDKKGKNLYLINEFSGTVMAFRYRRGELTLRQTLQADQAGGGGSADIVLSPDGHHLYTSHRLKNDGVAIFEVAPNGLLTLRGYQTTGIHPRNLNITPDGRFLTVAARDSNAVEFYRIDGSALTPLPEATIHLSKPVCVIFR